MYSVKFMCVCVRACVHEKYNSSLKTTLNYTCCIIKVCANRFHYTHAID